MKRYFVVVFMSVALLLGCKSVGRGNSSGLNTIKINDPANFQEKIKAKAKVYPGFNVVGYSVQVYAFNDATKAPDQDSFSYCEYPRGIKVSKRFDGFTASSNANVGDAQKYFEQFSCMADKPAKGSELQAQFDQKLLTEDSSREGKVGSFSLIQYVSMKAEIEEQLNAGINQIKATTNLSEEQKEQMIAELKAQVSKASKEKDTYLMVFAGQEGSLPYYKYETDESNKGNTLIDVKLPTGFKNYCATVQYLCTSKANLKPTVCLGSNSTNPNVSSCSSEIKDGSVSVRVPLFWTAPFIKGDSSTITTEPGEDNIDVNVVPEVE